LSRTDARQIVILKFYLLMPKIRRFYRRRKMMKCEICKKKAKYTVRGKGYCDECLIEVI